MCSSKFTSNTLKVVTFNCKNLKSSVDEIRSLCSKCDVLVLQETWLLDCDLSMLDKIDSNFYGQGISAVDVNTKILQGRPHGGIAILWRKKLSTKCNIVNFDHRIIGLKFECNGASYLIVNVYLPYSCDKNFDEFLYYLNKIKYIVDESCDDFIYILGDYNSDVTKTNGVIRHKFGSELDLFVKQEDYSIVDVKMIQDNNCYTYYSNQCQTNSWIDHILCPKQFENLIVKTEILFDYVSSDHHPLLVEIECRLNDTVTLSEMSDNTSTSKKIKWNELSSEEIDKYRTNTECNLKNVKLNHELLLCDNPKCNDPGHATAITRMYDEIVTALVEASSEFCIERKPSYNQILGWNDYCKVAHSEARNAYLLWRNNGKPKQGIYFTQMKQTRIYFKYVLRKCKSDTDRLKANKLADNQLLTKGVKFFWKKIRKLMVNKIQH